MGYERLKPGRELDALVAEKVFGWTAVSIPKRFGIVERHLVAPGKPPKRHTVCEYVNGTTVVPCLPSHFLPRYSTDIAAAWELEEKFGFTITRNSAGSWEVYDELDKLILEADALPLGYGDTAAEAICMAGIALKGLGV